MEEQFVDVVRALNYPLGSQPVGIVQGVVVDHQDVEKIAATNVAIGATLQEIAAVEEVEEDAVEGKKLLFLFLSGATSSI